MEEPLFEDIDNFISTKDKANNCNQKKNAPWFTKISSGLLQKKNCLRRLTLRSKKLEDWKRNCTMREKTSNAVGAAKYLFVNKKAECSANPAALGPYGGEQPGTFETLNYLLSLTFHLKLSWIRQQEFIFRKM